MLGSSRMASMLERFKMRLEMMFVGNPANGRLFSTGKLENGEYA
jgi:hypothetical protein